MTFAILAAAAAGRGVATRPAPVAGAPKVATTRTAVAEDEVFPAGDAESVIYVLPADGSLMTTFDPLRQVLSDAIGRLRPNQRFNVIFIDNEGGLAVAKAPLPATPENVRKGLDFLDTAPGFHGDPIGALRTAFAQRPTRLFFLENGDAPNDAAVTEAIQKLNAKLKPADRVQVHTVGWIDHDEGYEKWLKDLAAENGGTYRFVDEAFLDRVEKARARRAATRPSR